MKKFFVILSLLFSLTLSAQDAEKDTRLHVGDKMPKFTLNSEVYGKVTSRSLKGKVVLVSLFATWCPPCQLELAAVEKDLYPKYKDNEDFVLLVVGREHNDADLQEYNKKKNFTFPLYPDVDREFFSLFADSTIPRTFLFDKRGKVVLSEIGYSEEGFEELLETIESLLQK